MYKWTKDDLKKKIDLYKKAMEAETDLYKKAQMACEIDYDTNLLFSEFNDIKLPNDSFKKRLFNAYNTHLIASRYVDLALDFHDGVMHDDVDLFKAIYTFDRFQKGLKRKNDTIHFSNEAVLKYANEFYHSFDDELYNYFLMTYRQRRDHVSFSPVTQVGDYMENGYCLYLYSDKSNYLNLLESAGIEPVYNGIHEFGHAIANSYNPKAILFDNKTNEVSSFFPEFVALDWNIAGVTPLLRASKELELINVLHSFASNIFYQNQILYIWANHNYKTDFSFYLDCFENGFSYATIKETFNGNVNDDLTYATSAYIAFYFLSLHRRDRELAIAKYKEYLSFNDKDDVLHEFRSSQVKEEVYEEIGRRISGIFEVGQRYRRKR